MEDIEAEQYYRSHHFVAINENKTPPLKPLVILCPKSQSTVSNFSQDRDFYGEHLLNINSILLNINRHSLSVIQRKLNIDIAPTRANAKPKAGSKKKKKSDIAPPSPLFTAKKKAPPREKTEEFQSQ
jgi:hypothetical protein